MKVSPDRKWIEVSDCGPRPIIVRLDAIQAVTSASLLLSTEVVTVSPEERRQVLKLLGIGCFGEGE